MNDGSQRDYLSATEVAQYLKITVREVHRRALAGLLPVVTAASGQYRFRLADVQSLVDTPTPVQTMAAGERMDLAVHGTTQTIVIANAQHMAQADNSVHLAITSPPYFNAKMYSAAGVEDDLGNIHSLEGWFAAIGQVWAEVYRVLQPGRKFFLNIMNLPVREAGTFRTLNLVGQSIDRCSDLGFVFKRDIVWQKTNGVRAHFGTYPYPGGILINNMHEFILEFEKPCLRGHRKYSHLTAAQKEQSRLSKEFWLSLKNSDVWLMKPEPSGDRRRHIAPFPLELPARLIRAYSYVSETVLDPLAGSGTTLLAAARLGRNGLGYELNPEYAMLTRERLQAEADAASPVSPGEPEPPLD